MGGFKDGVGVGGWKRSGQRESFEERVRNTIYEISKSNEA